MQSNTVQAEFAPAFPYTPSHIRRFTTPVKQRGDEEREFIYTDPLTGRQFDIRQMADGDYFMTELYPNGRCAEFDEQGNLVRAWTEPLVVEARRSPNDFLKTITDAGIDPDTVIYVSGGFSINSRYLQDLDQCALAIHQALSDNACYAHTRELTKGERIALDRSSAADSAKSSKEQLAYIEAAMQFERGLFKGCHQPLGQPLSAETKHAILAYLNGPSQEAWLGIRNKCVIGFDSLWACWTRSDATAPRMGQEGFPSADQLRAALAYGVEAALKQARERAAKASRPSGLTVIK